MCPSAEPDPGSFRDPTSRVYLSDDAVWRGLDAEALGDFETLAATPGWVVVVGESQALFDQAWQRPLKQLAAGSAVGMLVALLVAAWLARAIARPVRDLARNAQTVAAATDAWASA